MGARQPREAVSGVSGGIPYARFVLERKNVRIDREESSEEGAQTVGRRNAECDSDEAMRR